MQGESLTDADAGGASEAFLPPNAARRFLRLTADRLSLENEAD